MKKKEREKYRKEVGDVMEKWLKKLHMQGWDLFVFLPEDAGWREPSKDGFATWVEHPYKIIKLFISEYELDSTIPKENRDESLLHEAIHVVLWDYAFQAESRHTTKNQLQDAEERLCDHLKNVILSL